MEADEKAIWIARRLLGFIALRELLINDDTEADARARCLLYLLDNRLVTL